MLIPIMQSSVEQVATSGLLVLWLFVAFLPLLFVAWLLDKPVRPPPRCESPSRCMTAHEGVSLGSGTPLVVRGSRGVYRPENHLAWLSIRLCLFPDAK